ncbi:DUF5655 domain-containing protein [Microbacterium sp. CFBP9034]|uniref:DUF5655 domain-containing protein n=1 Tax=Microbacterium sp. CFBP9034 TaxID=3096540 RepID=UPI002A6A2CA5|nr:DUF5655 domain-containing protein [Microbacterium sp. CFBP9034]MDY0908541.1 DUF5655 domain-containing protein [Microbacterium sp. CFBP9034]
MAEPIAGEAFFAPDKRAVSIYRALARPLIGLQGVEVAVSKSQVAFRARRAFALAWAPKRYVKSDVPVVVSIALKEKLDSSRFKEVSHPSPTAWMHHLELRLVKDVDQELISWIKRAYEEAL